MCTTHTTISVLIKSFLCPSFSFTTFTLARLRLEKVQVTTANDVEMQIVNYYSAQYSILVSTLVAKMKVMAVATSNGSRRATE